MNTSGKDHPSGRGASLPGQPTEEAVAEVGSEAGKSLVRGFGRLGNAALGGWITAREAKAEALRLAIETEAKIKAATAVVTARREQELADVEHEAALRRRADRLRIEFAREQLNWEAVERKAIEYTERDPKNDNAREIDEDWLFKFADYAQKVSDQDIQALWARALSSAAMQEAQKLSAAALQTLGLFDRKIAESFKRAAAAEAAFGFLPYPRQGERDVQQIRVALLSDLGLVKPALIHGAYKFRDFTFEEEPTFGPLPSETHNVFDLTLRGQEIARAVFRHPEDLSLSEEHEQQYLQTVLVEQFEYKSSVTILPEIIIGTQQVRVRLTPKNALTEAIEGDDWQMSSGSCSARLRKLLVWAQQAYHIQMGAWPT